MKELGEIIQFKIVEKPVEIEKPVFVEKEIEVPKYIEVEYEKPIIKEIEYEKPIIREKDLTNGLRELIKSEIERCLAEVIQSLKISMEIPLSRVLQVRPGGTSVDISKRGDK